MEEHRYLGTKGVGCMSCTCRRGGGGMQMRGMGLNGFEGERRVCQGFGFHDRGWPLKSQIGFLEIALSQQGECAHTCVLGDTRGVRHPSSVYFLGQFRTNRWGLGLFLGDTCLSMVSPSGALGALRACERVGEADVMMMNQEEAKRARRSETPPASAQSLVDGAHGDAASSSSAIGSSKRGGGASH